MTKINEAAVEYVAAGWKLVKLPPGAKGPTADGWNLERNAVSDPYAAAGLHSCGIGLAHAYSGTCALDIDDWEKAEPWLIERGVSLRQLWDAPDAVHLLSGRPNRGKLLYRSAPFASKRPKGSGLELRCAASTGLTVQDVLPPSIHPDTAQPYRWGGPGDWRKLPQLPSELSAIIQSLNTPQHDGPQERTGAEPEEQLALLAQLDPSCGYDEWIRVGMALHHENGGSEDGFGMWCDWSAQSDKYPGPEKLRQHWDSFGHTTGAVVTLHSLGRVATADQFETVQLEPDERPDRFKFVPAPTFARGRSPHWIIKGVLPMAGLAVIYGDSGAGKTFAVLDIAGAIVRGIPWRGHRTKQGKVAYMCGEGADFFSRRLQAYSKYTGCDLEGLYVCPEAPNLLKGSGDHKLVIEQLKALGPVSLVVIDTLARSMPGGNENASEDMGALVGKCAAIHRATGAMVLLVHHSGKDQAKGARGHSSLRAAADAEIVVHRDPENASRTISLGKQKDGPDGDVYPFHLLPVPLGYDEDGDAIHSCVLVDPTTESQSQLSVDPFDVTKEFQNVGSGERDEGAGGAVAAGVPSPDAASARAGLPGVPPWEELT